MNAVEYSRMYEAEGSHWWYAGLHDLILRHVGREALRAGRALEIFDAGCGTGRLCALMAPFGRVEGCDSSELALGYCRTRGVPGVTLADLNEVTLEASRYDVITAIDVLYHRGIRDDVAVLRTLQAALRPGGMLLLNLVAWEFLRSTHDVAVHTRERYRRRTVRERLNRAGFEVEFISYRLCFLFPGMALYRLVRRLLTPAPSPSVASDVSLPPVALNRVLLGVVKAENRILMRCPLPVGMSVFAVARRGGAR